MNHQWNSRGPRRFSSFLISLGTLCLSAEGPQLLLAAERAPMPRFERTVIDDDFPGAYQVEVADVNGDGRPDVIAVGGGTCAWYENPSWKKRLVTTPEQTPGIISSATADLDGDGKAEIAIAYEFAMNQPTRGKLLLATQGKGIDDPWAVKHVADVGSIHRLRWGSVMGTPRVSPGRVTFDKRLELVVAPIFGPSARPPIFNQEPAHILLFDFIPREESKPPSPAPGGNLGGGNIGGVGGGTGGIKAKGGGLGGGSVGGLGGGPLPGDSPVPDLDEKWKRPSPRKIGDAPVLHAIEVIDLDGNGYSDVLGASNLGVTQTAFAAVIGAAIFRTFELVPGAPGEAPKKGASEIHVGRLEDGRRFLATVEPWHGTDVAVYLAESLKPQFKFGPRTVLDTSLKEGHALWVADVDGDGDDEVFAGYRGPGTSVLAYDFNGKTWDRTVIDPAIAAQDLRGGDLDGDGTPDVVAVGGKTHNVVWYHPVPKKDVE